MNRRRIGGKRAKSNGKAFEKLIEASCSQFEREGRCFIKKTPEPFRMLKRQGNKVIGFYEEKAQPDFAGTLKSGRSIVFEAKNTNGTNIPFNRVKKHQKEALMKHYKLGADAFVLISFNLMNFYKVDIGNWIELERILEKKSANEKDLAEFKAPFVNRRIEFIEPV